MLFELEKNVNSIFLRKNDNFSQNKNRFRWPYYESWPNSKPKDKIPVDGFMVWSPSVSMVLAMKIHSKARCSNYSDRVFDRVFWASNRWWLSLVREMVDICLLSGKSTGWWNIISIWPESIIFWEWFHGTPKKRPAVETTRWGRTPWRPSFSDNMMVS